LILSVFFPPSYDARGASTKFPALFVVHGGGFILGDPIDTEKWNRTFCDQHGMVVVALNYRKAPRHPFPEPMHDIEVLLLSCLADERDLGMIDQNRVALAGWSAGGHFTMAVAQLETVRDRVRAIIPIYPVLDFATTPQTKQRRCRRKPELGGSRGQAEDMVMTLAGLFNWSYHPVGQDLRDPLISPAWTTPERLPGCILMIGVELDSLAHEAWSTICRFAGRKVPEKEECVGSQRVWPKGELVLDDERYYFDEKKEDGRRYTWLLVPDSVHGFDQLLPMHSKDTNLVEDSELKTAKVIDFVGRWLLDGPLNVPRS
jgi:acetyl esterase/lipase